MVTDKASRMTVSCLITDFSGFLLPERQTRSVLPGGRWRHRHHGPRQHPGVRRRPEVPGSAARVEGPEAEDDQRDTQRHKGKMMMIMTMMIKKQKQKKRKSGRFYSAIFHQQGRVCVLDNKTVYTLKAQK